ncbi:MAG: RseA family anti-sigma factor [Succinivibrio sp.]
MQDKNTAVNDEEILSANFDGEDLGRLHEVSAEDRRHLENWAAMGAALRGELPDHADMGFADAVMARIAREEPAEQPVAEPEKKVRMLSLRKLGFIFGQAVAAASICMVTIFGYQAWNADDNASDTQAVGTMGTIGGVNLASYQNRGSGAITLDAQPQLQQAASLSPREQRDLAEKRQQEESRINNYLRGYVLDTASN